jgi:uncharacterized protein involved in exopolysaccharide biosynthesis
MELYALATRLTRCKGLVAVGFGAVMLTALLLCFTLPKKYCATAVILPKTSADQLLLGRLSPGLGMQSRIDWMIPKVINSEENLMAVMRHPFKIRDRTGQRKLSLAALSGRTDRAALLKKAADYIRVSTDGKDGSIWISVITPYPDMSYKVASKILEDLDEFVEAQRGALQSSYADYYRSRLEEAKRDLVVAELELTDYLTKNRAWLESDDPRENLEIERFERKQRIYIDVYKEVKEQRELDDIKTLALIPPIDVLDYPTIPTVKCAPRRKIILSGGFAAALLLSFMILVVGEWLGRRRVA